MAMAQTKERMNKIITGAFFILAATTLNPAHIPPRPTTIIIIKGIELAKTGGATESIPLFFFQHNMPIKLRPTNSRPKELTGINISSSATKSQIFAAYSSFQSALQKPAKKH